MLVVLVRVLVVLVKVCLLSCACEGVLVVLVKVC